LSTPSSADDPLGSRVKLLPARGTFWQQPVPEPAFAAFADWTKRYATAASAAARAALEAEGMTLARRRLTALADLIMTQPERALELALPASVRRAMPAAVLALLEEPVNTYGDYTSLCALHLPGQAPLQLARAARVNGLTHRVFTFGAGLDYVTRTNVPLNGLSVPLAAASAPPGDEAGLKPARLMVLDPSPARLLEESETGPGVVGLEFGGERWSFPTLAAAVAWAGEATTAAHLDSPQGADLPTAESSYTEGRKRFLLMRVDFPDYTGDVFPTNSAVNHMRDMSNFLAQISYFKHIIAPVGEGTDITPIMRMSENAAAYDGAGLSKLYPEARDVARTNFGYDLSHYDFFFVCTGGKPAYSYAGLGYVGGVGYHLANGYFDVRTSAHEFGHNLGLGHANWWNTGGASVIGPGTSDEYGDDFDTMGGSGGGLRHFSSTFKNRLGWIPNSDALTVTASGSYRLYAQDIAQAPVGLRCLRLNRPGGDPYCLEFRQLWTDNKAMMHGVAFRRAGGSSILLDMRPGSAGGKSDHPLTIGRTFSDPGLNYHVTVLGKGHTYPESLDVAIQLGPFPTNQPPTVVASAGMTNASLGQMIGFSAQAADPNGDALAYFWDFGDGDYSVDNSAATTHSFGGVGEYTVEVTVSDMKGGTARDLVVVRVGSPATYSISGRVLNVANQPVAGIRLSTDASHYAESGSDGTYTITRLGAGSHTVTAEEPTYGTNAFATPFFSNPVTVGPSFTMADFVMLKGSLDIYTPILAKRSGWKYLDNGSDQGTNWFAASFNEAGWSNGPAILGYGQGYESTVLSYGPDANNKFITSYFRRSFVATNLANYTNLLLQVLRDDGIAVYLNGSEVYRDNLPNGTVPYSTPASDTVEPDTNAYLQATLPLSALRPGTNVIAAEVHQADPTSSDLTFDLALSGLSVSNAASLTLVYLSSPASGQSYFSPTNVTLNAFARSGGAAVSQVEFFADGARLGSDATAPYSLVWTNPANGSHTLQVVATAGGLLVTSAPVEITVSAPVVVRPAFPLSFIATGAVWKYLAGPTSAPPAWVNLGYSDQAWPSGAAELGYGDGGEATAILYGGDSNNKWITTYFRRIFVARDPAAVTNLWLRLKRDDGARVFLNGVEVLRDYLPTGTISWATLATQSVPDDGQTFNGFGIDPAGLVVGTNLLAVEIHQAEPTSSDVSFDLALDGLAWTNRPRGVYFTSPAEGSLVSMPGGVVLTAAAVAGANLGIRSVEFFSDGVKVGEATAFPYRYAWNSPPSGTHQLLAVAADSAGGAITSAPVHITVAAPPVSQALVSFGAAWKYLDDGSDQGTNWSGRGFDDRAWQTGAAKFGYGRHGEVTTLSSGTNGAARNITAYFRTRFVAAQPGSFGGLRLRLVREDAAAVYLNGREVYRDNLLDGPITFTSLALEAIDPPEALTPLEVTLATTGLVAGTNVLAVELHQASIASLEAGFDLELLGLTATNTSRGLYLTSPANNAQVASPAAVILAAQARADGDTISLVEYFDGSSKIGQSVVDPYQVTWVEPPTGLHTLVARATLGSGPILTSAPVTITVAAPPPPIQPLFQTFIPAGSVWKYWDNVSSVGAGWTRPDFDDQAWPDGLARLGWGWDGEVTTLTEGRVTAYFRGWFTVTNPALLTDLIFELARDDGAVVYLNGQEVFRSNMPDGPVNAVTPASTTVNTPDETTYFETVVAAGAAGLLTGSNLVAVELHQSSATSSDAGFDLQLIGYGTTEPRILFSRPAGGATFAPGTTVNLEAIAYAGDAAAVNMVEFYADGVKLGESQTPPYRWDWATPGFGPHTVIARAVLSTGGVLVSAPLEMAVAREVFSTTCIPSNSVWRYLDNGSNQGTNWAQPAFNDESWKSGAAELGYGDGGEITLISYGPNSSSKYITTYLRRWFVVPAGPVYTNLTCTLLRDDGAVVWLNGRELYRDNMPASVITYQSLASSNVNGAVPEATFYSTSIAVTNLTAGTNLLAVEIHQNSVTSSDMSFDLELTASGYVDDSKPVSLTARFDEGLIELSWPVAALGYRLYSAPAVPVALPQWTPVAVTPVVRADRYVVTLPLDGPAQFYRLGNP
jgi:hypothetical protein